MGIIQCLGFQIFICRHFFQCGLIEIGFAPYNVVSVRVIDLSPPTLLELKLRNTILIVAVPVQIGIRHALRLRVLLNIYC